jgi:hypothetical protein
MSNDRVSGGSERKLVEVQILSTAPYIYHAKALINQGFFVFLSDVNLE